MQFCIYQTQMLSILIANEIITPPNPRHTLFLLLLDDLCPNLLNFIGSGDGIKALLCGDVRRLLLGDAVLLLVDVVLLLPPDSSNDRRWNDIMLFRCSLD